MRTIQSSNSTVIGALSAAGLLLAAIISVGACSSKNETPPTTGPTGGPVTGAKDSHCGTKSQAVSSKSCSAPPPDAGTDSAGDATADAPPEEAGDGGGGSEYGPTMYNDEADDDDCKYHMKWSGAGIQQNKDVSLSVVVNTKADGKAATGVPIRLEVFLDETHPGPNTAQTSKESATPGTYTVGPIKFDKPGKWTVRFHFHEECTDALEDSPHGHAAFFVNVP